MYSGFAQRFTLLLLEEGEDYVSDYNAYCYAPGILTDLGKQPTQIQEASFTLPAQHQRVHGKLRLCTKSMFFDADDASVPILRLPFPNVVGCNSIGPKELHIKTTFYTTCKANNLDRPYVHQALTYDASVLIQLEFASMDSLMLQLMQVLDISKTSDPTERDARLKEFAKTQAEATGFDYRRLTDEFQERVLLECRARQVTPLIKQPGILVITDHGLYFQPLHNLAGGAVVKFHPASAITSLARRRVAMQPLALEVFLTATPATHYLAADQRWEAPSVMFLFEDREARERAHRLLSRLDNFGADVKGSSALQRGSLLEGKGAWLLHVQNAWLHGKVSNLEYLLYLNFAAGRTFNDLAQWPVFPWVLADYTSQVLDLESDGSFRDLGKPMGALGHPGRLAEAREKYEITSGIPGGDPGFMYGAHYSTPGYVMYWLVRKTPEQMLRLQNGRFDAADRLFFSIAESWTSSTGRSNTDVKELIPEFFLPSAGDFLVNSNNLPLGKRQNGQQVADVELPRWACGPADFIWKHRQALESRYVQANLHKWIDLIFGCKQRGQAAVDADNLFWHTSYEGAVDLDSIKDPVMRRAKEAMISEFGQTPAQLFDEHQPHPPRKVIQPLPLEPLPGYCGSSSPAPEVSHALVRILLEVSASEQLQSVLASPRAGSPPFSTSLHSPTAPAPGGPRRTLQHVLSASLEHDLIDGDAATARQAGFREPVLRSGSGLAVSVTRDHSESTAAGSPLQPTRSVAAASDPGCTSVADGAGSQPNSPGAAQPAASGMSLDTTGAALRGDASCEENAVAGLGGAEEVDGQRHDRGAGAAQLDRGPWGAPGDGVVDDAAVSVTPWPPRLHERIRVEHTVECPREQVTAVLGLGPMLVSGTAAGALSIHSVATGAAQQSLKLPRVAPVSALASPGSQQTPSCILAAAFSRVHAYALDYGTALGEFEPHADAITAMSASPGGPSGGVLYTASEDTTIRSWSTSDERCPWSAVVPPLFEADSPEASVPTAVHAHTSGSAVIGTDAGHCAILDVRSGRAEWCWQDQCKRIADVVSVPAADLCSVVVAYEDGQLGLLDLRRQGNTAMLAHVIGGAHTGSIVTDGNSALAGTQQGLLLWNLDPAAEQTAKDIETGISCTGAGMAFRVDIGGSYDSISCLSAFDYEQEFRVAVGHGSGLVHLCSGNKSD